MFCSLCAGDKRLRKKVLERATLMFLHSFPYKNERAAQEFCETTLGIFCSPAISKETYGEKGKWDA
jgi:hypothetical protein